MTRRELVWGAGTVAVARVGWGRPFGLPVGLQLFCLREMLAKDFAGTLRMVGELGYQEVEGVGFGGKTAGEVKKALQDAGLRCPSVHFRFAEMTARVDEIVRFCGELGLDYVVCSTPGFRDPERVKGMTRAEMQGAYTLDDWLWTAERLNGWGETVKAAGMRLAYHNGVPECRAMADGVVPWELFVKETDPSKVWFEMDAAWIKVGGQDPMAYVKKYADRVVMLHVKDYKGGPPGANGLPEPTEMGRGGFDNRGLLAAMDRRRVKHVFVEQEGFDLPVWESLRIDAEAMKKLLQ